MHDSCGGQIRKLRASRESERASKSRDKADVGPSEKKMVDIHPREEKYKTRGRNKNTIWAGV
jgi:hypothetical protein